MSDASAIAGPWDVARLQQTPEHELRKPRTVRDGDRTSVIREVYFSVEPFLGRPARAFAYLARPQRCDEPLPAMLLIHGGGGTAVEAWTRFWSSRGYVALSMDLYGQGPG